jgi:hypothetical protein
MASVSYCWRNWRHNYFLIVSARFLVNVNCFGLISILIQRRLYGTFLFTMPSLEVIYVTTRTITKFLLHQFCIFVTRDGPRAHVTCA